MTSKYDQLRFDQTLANRQSFLQKYQDLVVGDRSFGRLLHHELLTLLVEPIPGRASVTPCSLPVFICPGW